MLWSNGTAGTSIFTPLSLDPCAHRIGQISCAEELQLKCWWSQFRLINQMSGKKGNWGLAMAASSRLWQLVIGTTGSSSPIKDLLEESSLVSYSLLQTITENISGAMAGRWMRVESLSTIGCQNNLGNSQQCWDLSKNAMQMKCIIVTLK